MTVFKEDDKPGFYTVCCNCGWHSLVHVSQGPGNTVIFSCDKCDQEVEYEG